MTKAPKEGGIPLLPAIEKNKSLGRDLGIRGTPFIVVMPTQGANAHNTTVFAGYPTNPADGMDMAVKALQKAIDKANMPKVVASSSKTSSKR